MMNTLIYNQQMLSACKCVIPIIFFSLAACGGGSSSGSSGSPGDSPGDGDNNTGMNGDLSGAMFFIDNSGGDARTVFVNLESGELNVVSDVYPRGFSASDDGQKVILASQTNSSASGVHDIALLNRSGQELNRLRLDRSLVGLPRLNPDESLFLIRQIPSFGSDYALRVFNWSGQQVATFPEPFDQFDSPNIDSWDWLSSDSFIFAQDHGLYRVNDLADAPQLISSFTGSNYYIYHLDVSPDGSKIALSLTDQRANVGGIGNHIWIMNTDGSGLQQVTTSNAREDSPSWNPDGTKLAFRYGGSTPAGSDLPDNCPLVVVVSPFNGLIDLNATNADEVQIIRYDSDGDLQPVCAQDASATRNSDLSWRS